MAQLQNLVLTDRAATPVAHTFVPRDVVSNVGTVVESSASGIPIGNSRFSVNLKQTSTGKYKASLKLVVPVVAIETINGISNPKVVRTHYADVEFTFDSTSTTDERNSFVGMLQSALAPERTLVNDTIVGLQNVF